MFEPFITLSKTKPGNLVLLFLKICARITFVIYLKQNFVQTVLLYLKIIPRLMCMLYKTIKLYLFFYQVSAQYIFS